MVKRGTVWIAPQGWVPSGRMVDPRTTDFWVSWQDNASLADEVIGGADAAIEWGRLRADKVLIRLGHSQGTYFSAGAVRPADDEDDEDDDVGVIPDWPPVEPPPDGWWYPPPVPTLADVAAKTQQVSAGELDQATAREWAEVMFCVLPPDVLGADPDLIRALWALRGTDEPINR